MNSPNVPLHIPKMLLPHAQMDRQLHRRPNFATKVVLPSPSFLLTDMGHLSKTDLSEHYVLSKKSNALQQ